MEFPFKEEDYCDWCNGFGSSLKDPIGVDTCTRCGGTGIKVKVITEEKK